MNLYNK